MTEAVDAGPPVGGVPLAEAITGLRAELLRAWTDADGKSVRFRVRPVELTIESVVTWSGEAGGGVKWWLIDASAKVSRERAMTQTIKLTLDPVTTDRDGKLVEIFVTAADSETRTKVDSASTEISLEG